MKSILSLLIVMFLSQAGVAQDMATYLSTRSSCDQSLSPFHSVQYEWNIAQATVMRKGKFGWAFERKCGFGRQLFNAGNYTILFSEYYSLFIEDENKGQVYTNVVIRNNALIMVEVYFPKYKLRKAHYFNEVIELEAAQSKLCAVIDQWIGELE